MTTANKVTILRMLLIPFFVVEILYYVRTGNELHRLLAILTFAVAAICDGVDGYIARHYNQRSELGAILDPLADKLLLVSTGKALCREDLILYTCAIAMISSSHNMPPGGKNSAQRSPEAEKKIVLAHFSDPHIACLGPVKKRDLLNKRLLGYLRWRWFRKRRHQDEILSILQKDLKSTRPDHTIVTGDLTHLGLPAEFQKAQIWLQSLGTPAQVTIVPGNHDNYVRSNWNQTFAWWLDYMISDRPDQQGTRVSGFETITVRFQTWGDTPVGTTPLRAPVDWGPP